MSTTTNTPQTLSNENDNLSSSSPSSKTVSPRQIFHHRKINENISQGTTSTRPAIGTATTASSGQNNDVSMELLSAATSTTANNPFSSFSDHHEVMHSNNNTVTTGNTNTVLDLSSIARNKRLQQNEIQQPPTASLTNNTDHAITSTTSSSSTTTVARTARIARITQMCQTNFIGGPVYINNHDSGELDLTMKDENDDDLSTTNMTVSSFVTANDDYVKEEKIPQEPSSSSFEFPSWILSMYNKDHVNELQNSAKLDLTTVECEDDDDDEDDEGKLMSKSTVTISPLLNGDIQAEEKDTGSPSSLFDFHSWVLEPAFLVSTAKSSPPQQGVSLSINSQERQEVESKIVTEQPLQEVNDQDNATAINIDDPKTTPVSTTTTKKDRTSKRLGAEGGEAQLEVGEEERHNANKRHFCKRIKTCQITVLIVIGIIGISAIGIGVLMALGVLDSSDSKDSKANNGKSYQQYNHYREILSNMTNVDLIQQLGSPQNLAFEWLIMEDEILSSLMSPSKSSTSKLTIAQEDNYHYIKKVQRRYALAVFYYAVVYPTTTTTTVENDDEVDIEMFSASSSKMSHNQKLHHHAYHLDGMVDECEWTFVGCNNNKTDIVSINVYRDYKVRNEDDDSKDGGSIDNIRLGDALPLELEVLTSLDTLKVERFHLVGRIPHVVYKLPFLRTLDLSHNRLSGTIESEISTLTNLRNIFLDDNDLYGALPEELFELHHLETLSLARNVFRGSIPPRVGELSDLRVLSLADNYFMGSIPLQLYNATSLRLLRLSSNELTGKVSPMMGNLIMLESLWLDGNQLTSSIPSEVGVLKHLKSLYLMKNSLSSSVPTEVGRLTNLVRFDFQFNQMSGPIPADVCDLHVNTTFMLYCDRGTECNCCEACR